MDFGIIVIREDGDNPTLQHSFLRLETLIFTPARLQILDCDLVVDQIQTSVVGVLREIRGQILLLWGDFPSDFTVIRIMFLFNGF